MQSLIICNFNHRFQLINIQIFYNSLWIHKSLRNESNENEYFILLHMPEEVDEGGIYIFAYGSLLWRTVFEYEHKLVVIVYVNQV